MENKEKTLEEAKNKFGKLRTDPKCVLSSEEKRSMFCSYLAQ